MQSMKRFSTFIETFPSEYKRPLSMMSERSVWVLCPRDVRV
jgi:hypothetical protein